MKESIFKDKLQIDSYHIKERYKAFYDPQTHHRRVDYARRLAWNYNVISNFQSAYCSTPTRKEDMIKYVRDARDGVYVLKQQDSPTLRDALFSADSEDYFHFLNPHATRQRPPEAARRIVVGLYSQENALPLADALITLMQDPRIGPYIDEFKVYLSFNRTPGQPDKQLVKGDKAVVYYVADLQNLESDTVGDAIVRTIDRAVPTQRRETQFAPFYDEIVQGIAWADETGQASFTQVRDDLMGRVVRKHETIAGEDEFYVLVLKEMAEFGVDPDATHRYFTDVATPPAPKLT